MFQRKPSLSLSLCIVTFCFAFLIIDISLVFVIYNHLKNGNRLFTFPAPGSYDVEKSEKIIHQSSGAVTFGIKYKNQKPDDVPGEFLINLFAKKVKPAVLLMKK